MNYIKRKTSNVTPGMIGLIVGLVILAIALYYITGAAFLQLGWNHGIVHAFGTHAISYPTAFSLFFLVNVIGGAFNFSLNSSAKKTD